jgi:TPR repeat protein
MNSEINESEEFDPSTAMKIFKTTLLAAILVLSCTTLMAQGLTKELDNRQPTILVAALSKWIPLASTGNAEAQFNVGLMYKDGDGVPQDYAKTAEWYRKAAEQGYPNAQYNLGVLYQLGEWISHDFT